MVYCTRCGCECAEGSKFCAKCGAALIYPASRGNDSGCSTYDQPYGAATNGEYGAAYSERKPKKKKMKWWVLVLIVLGAYVVGRALGGSLAGGNAGLPSGTKTDSGD